MSWRGSVGSDLPAPQDIFPSLWFNPSPFFYALEDTFNRCSRPQLTMVGGKLRLIKEDMISPGQIEHCYPTKTVQCFITLLWCSLAVSRGANKTLLWYKTYSLHYTKNRHRLNLRHITPNCVELKANSTKPKVPLDPCFEQTRHDTERK